MRDDVKRLCHLSIALLLCLAACAPVPSAIDGSHIAVPQQTPPAATPAQSDPSQSAEPVDPNDPIAAWRADPIFKDAEVILPDAQEVSILLVENVVLDWEKLKPYAFGHLGRDIEITEWINYFKDSGYPGKEKYGDDYWGYGLMADYDGKYEIERARIGHWVPENRYTLFIGPIDGFGRNGTLGTFSYEHVFSETSHWEDGYQVNSMRYSAQEAVDMATALLLDWGVPAEGLEVQAVLAHDSIPYMHPDPYTPEGQHPKKVEWEKEPNFLIRFRHVVGGIPVYDGIYGYRLSGLQMEDNIFIFGEYADIAINDQGIRQAELRWRNIVQVLEEDVEIVPLETIMQNHARSTSESNAAREGYGSSFPPRPVKRIELVWLPSYVAEEPYTRYQLIPVWCFRTATSNTLIDARTGMRIP